MPAAAPPSPTIRALLARRELDLRLATPADDDANLDAPVRWVHSSDLADPTPFLSEDVVLLTTGTQFAGDSDAEAEAEAYVGRLRARGVRGLGFGTEVVRDGIPDSLRLACTTAGMPLFEVPYRTPFIAVARAAAEAIAAQAYARRSWALDAQRALAIAALRPDGFDATLAELARQLGAWVGLYDASGTLTHEHSSAGSAVDGDLRGAVGAEAAALLRRGGGTGAAMRLAGHPVTLQTLGSGGQRGVLVTAGAELDQDARAVVTAVVATTGLALEQRRMTAGAWSGLRAALVDLLADGHLALARKVATDAWGGFPAAPYVVAVADAHAPTGAREVLDNHAAGGRLFYGRDEDGVLLIVGTNERHLLDEIAARLSWRLGTAAATTDDDVTAARDRARLARDRGRPGAVTDVVDAPGDLLDDLATAPARARAGAELTPLRTHDARHGTALEATLVAWLDHDGAHESTARALGVHRHTVRTRIALAQRLLGRDLSSFADRAAVWTALRLSP
ncbi:PucR family transcriptional regulator [Microbacterium sp. NE2HP2]|uniref:PucR family transcriptional regulator n=1 Tax=Microbacterium TaxID=33882 RepID=UPI0023662020|nr:MULTISPECIES: PucR family transcriptional regulator [Microbacterium]MDD7944624.1 PucR family transcriptional regulator [Microbacterium plantarum]WHE36924.1 PucR family transcriptional regulator [Microbacterium sp. BDGP8]